MRWELDFVNHVRKYLSKWIRKTVLKYLLLLSLSDVWWEKLGILLACILQILACETKKAAVNNNQAGANPLLIFVGKMLNEWARILLMGQPLFLLLATQLSKVTLENSIVYSRWLYLLYTVLSVLALGAGKS